MTHTIQPLSLPTAQKTEKAQLTISEENIQQVLAVCDSMDKLSEALERLAYVLQRKNIEASLKASQERHHKSAGNL